MSKPQIRFTQGLVVGVADAALVGVVGVSVTCDNVGGQLADPEWILLDARHSLDSAKNSALTSGPDAVFGGSPSSNTGVSFTPDKSGDYMVQVRSQSNHLNASVPKVFRILDDNQLSPPAFQSAKEETNFGGTIARGNAPMLEGMFDVAHDAKSSAATAAAAAASASTAAATAQTTANLAETHAQTGITNAATATAAAASASTAASAAQTTANLAETAAAAAQTTANAAVPKATTIAGDSSIAVNGDATPKAINSGPIALTFTGSASGATGPMAASQLPPATLNNPPTAIVIGSIASIPKLTKIVETTKQGRFVIDTTIDYRVSGTTGANWLGYSRDLVTDDVASVVLETSQERWFGDIAIAGTVAANMTKSHRRKHLTGTLPAGRYKFEFQVGELQKDTGGVGKIGTAQSDVIFYADARYVDVIPTLVMWVGDSNSVFGANTAPVSGGPRAKFFHYCLANRKAVAITGTSAQDGPTLVDGVEFTRQHNGVSSTDLSYWVTNFPIHFPLSGPPQRTYPGQPGAVTTAPPYAKVIMFQIGTNDARIGGTGIAGSDTKIANLLDSALTPSPATVDGTTPRVVVINVPPQLGTFADDASTATLNASWLAAVNTRIGAGKKISLLDWQSIVRATPSFATTLYSDTPNALHFNDAGMDLLGLSLFNHINGLASGTVLQSVPSPITIP